MRSNHFIDRELQDYLLIKTCIYFNKFLFEHMLYSPLVLNSGHPGDKGTLREQKAQEMARAEQVAKGAEERVAISHVPVVLSDDDSQIKIRIEYVIPQEQLATSTQLQSSRSKGSKSSCFWRGTLRQKSGEDCNREH